MISEIICFVNYFFTVFYMVFDCLKRHQANIFSFRQEHTTELGK